jgi:uncharacterized protein YbjT (DUF2867 family)
MVKPTQRLVFIGATGLLGRPVLKQFLSSQWKTCVLARRPPPAEQGRTLFGNAEILKGDLFDEESLRAALRPGDTVYLNLSVKPDERRTHPHTESEGLGKLLKVAREAGVARIAYLSSLVRFYQGMNGFDWWVFDIKHKAVQMIEASGIPSIIYNPSTFMENFHGGQRRGNTLALAGTSEHPMWFIAGEDYGRQVLQSFELPCEGTRTFAIQGLEAFRADEAAEVFIRHYPHAKLKISRAPLGLIKALGYVSTSMNYLGHILEALNKYPETFQSELTWRELGKPKITLKDFALRSP